MRIEQSADVYTSRWEVQKTIALNEIRKAGSNYYKALTAGVTGTVRPSVLEGTESDGDPGVVWQYLHSGFGIVQITGYTSTTVVTATVLERLPDSVVTGSASATISGIVADVDFATVTTTASHGFVTGDIVTIAGVVGMTEANGTWTVTVTGLTTFTIALTTVQTYSSGGTVQKTLTGTNTYKWSLGAWGGTQGYPTAVTYHQQRQVFGGTTAAPQTCWMSRSGGYTDFGQSVPMLDDDGITFTLAAQRMNQIRHLMVMQELVALTSEGAWKITKEQGNLIPICDFQGRGGASHVAPVVINQRALFVMDKGSSIRSLGYFFESDSYEGKDLTMTANHLLFGKSVVDWAYQEIPFSTVWVVTSDGGLLGLTYMPDQEVIGWHRHDTDGTFESVCCISEGTEDAVYAVVNRTIGGATKRYVERMASRFFTESEDAYFVDSGLTYDGRDAGTGISWTLTGGTNWTYDETLTFTTDTDFFTGVSDVGDVIVTEDSTGAEIRFEIIGYTGAKIVTVNASRTVPADLRGVAHTSWDMARDTFTGLSHLEGKTVSILADGNVQTPQVVASGAISLPRAATVVHVGLPIEADFETLDLNVSGQSLQDKKKNVSSVTLIVEDTRGLACGPDEDNLLDLPRSATWQYGDPVEAVTGTVSMNILSTWSDGGRVFIRQSDPLPATILAVIPEVTVGG